MRTLVITGGIGSGKSTVCRYFAGRGIPVYDSDSRTRMLYDSDPGLLRKVMDALKADVTDPSGRLDRMKLASVVFSDSVKLRILESVVHPAVRKDYIEWNVSFEGSGVPFVIMESAIILEKPLFRDIADKVLLVDAPVQVRLDRACRRDGVSREKILQRMSGQVLLNEISGGKAVADVDFVIVNDGDEDSLFRKADAVYDFMCGK